jgi:hypothetical protein
MNPEQTLMQKAQEDLAAASGTANLRLVPDAEPSVTLVSLTFRKTQPKRLVNAIASANGVQLVEATDSYVIAAPYIKVLRSEIEAITGKLSDVKWRMIFVNRKGEVKEFTNHEFAIGVASVASVNETERKEAVQLNIRIDKQVKEEMEKYRGKDFLDRTQNDFVEDALKEFIANIQKELV